MTHMHSSLFGYEAQTAHPTHSNYIDLPFLTSCEHTERRLNETLIVHHFETGDVIQMRGGSQHRVYVVLQGAASLSAPMSDGHIQMLRLILPTDIVGRLATDKTQYDAVALTPVTACSFSRSDFEALLRLSPELARRLLHKSWIELDETREWLLMLRRKTAVERVASFLALLQKRSWGHARNAVSLPLCQFEIAELLELEYGSVVREMAELHAKGIIRYESQRKVVICDLSALLELSGSEVVGPFDAGALQ